MERHIFNIGYAKYRINTDALSVFMEEAKNSATEEQADPYCDAEKGAGNTKVCADRAVEDVFAEVMHLYHEYAGSQNMDALVRLKCRLEEVSLRYRSFVLAEEVLSINSCLPYERRVPCGNAQE